MPKTSRAAVLTEPGNYEIRELPVPELEEGALLVKMEMSGICGTDKHTFLGETVQYAGTEAEMRTPFPIVQRHENVGIVAKITRSAARHIEYYGEELSEGDRIVWSESAWPRGGRLVLTWRQWDGSRIHAMAPHGDAAKSDPQPQCV